MRFMEKVLIIFNHPAPYKVRLFNELSKSFDLHVIFERNAASDRNKKFYFEDSYKFKLHEIKGIKIGRENIISKGVKKHLKENNYDLIIMNGYSNFSEMKALSYLKRKKMPYVLYINGGKIKPREFFLKKIIKRHYISGASAYFSPDKESNKYLVHYGAQENKILNYPYSTIYENEIVKERPDKKAIQQELGIKFDKVFVSSGQLIKRKNYISLVEEWEKFPENYGLFLIGDGKQRGEIEKIITTNNMKNVVLTGFLSRTEMFKYFKASDIFLFPSKEDIYGHVINEAMSQGLPTISTNKVNSAINLIDDGKNGFLLNELSNPSLCDAIEKLNNIDCFENCILTASDNTIEKMAKRHVEMFKEVMKK